MIVLGIDFETTGLDSQKHRVIEVGSVLWDTSTSTPWRILSELCYSDELPEMEPEAAATHGLTLDMLKLHGCSHVSVFHRLNELCSGIEAFVGHNCIQFDKPFYESEMKRASIPTCSVPWIDTTTDLKYPSAITTRKLTHLAAEHGFLNPFAHRAVFDVLTMLRVFQQYDPVAARDYAAQPMLTIQACVSFDDRQKAKDRGYRWKPETRQWLKSCRVSDAEVEKQSAGFKVMEVA